ncbi:snake venom 5'-nucleotidase-like [Branchiostoma floridae]|uniref:5'-nucleotidase n=1 Tax=Branchiostoma floridae TaxID=7739 RepID=A0A9J7HHL0_BRAFL|nr:snake venom 5'-nucleotidase-like [Branchiostoma floridae]
MRRPGKAGLLKVRVRGIFLGKCLPFGAENYRKFNMKVHVVASLVCLWVTSCLTFDLTVLHTNDCHARIQQADGNGGSCSDSEAAAGKCFGGVARRLTKIREIRNTDANVILLDGGDQFQGTLWFHFYQGLEAARFMNKMEYDVMAFGNHEFDNKAKGVIPFLKNSNHTQVCANIDASKVPELQRLFQPSVVLTVGGEKIGVIGYLTPNTTFLSQTGPDLVLSDEVSAITAEVRRLQGEGVNKFIALGHSGIKADITIAKQVPGLDLVVGGHSNTFLYKGTPPEDDPKYGEYPLTIQSEVESGRQVLVVQDYFFGKYLGYLKLTFNPAGEVTEFAGNPILLNSSISQDNETLAEVASMKGVIVNLTRQEVGRTHVYLDGRRVACRRGECNLGNVITDAMVRGNLKTPDEAKWADVSIAIFNSGNIRAPIAFRAPNGVITGEDVLTVLPFMNTIDVIVLLGETLYEVFEHSVAELPDTEAGQFLQVSGLLLKYDLRKPVGKRVVSLEAKCSDCKVPQFEPVQKQKQYKVLANSYIAKGGDGYTMIKEKTISMDAIGYLDTDIMLAYLKDASPITTGLDRRITFVDGTAAGSSSFVSASFYVLLMFPLLNMFTTLFG